MSSTFTKFLNEHAEKQAAAALANKSVVEEWRGAVERLFAQLPLSP